MMWYQKSTEEIFAELKSNPNSGISQLEATNRLNIYGKNILPRGKKITWYQFLFRQFKSPLVYILLVAAGFTTWIALFGGDVDIAREGSEPNRWVDTIVILLAVIVNVSVGFWQEFRSNNILEKLREIIRTNAFVVRDGETHEISAESLVPGDIIMLKVGNKVPADARILKAHKLKVNESILTGESSSVGKLPTDLRGEVQIGDRDNMVHMGTLVARGEGIAIVVSTGKESAFGEIAIMTQEAEDEPTPLQSRMGKLSSIIAVFVAVATLTIFVVGIIGGFAFVDILMLSIAVAVAAIPEGLPASISIVLAISAQKILKQKGVVKKLVAAESLGSASVICTDKTGTLTEGKMVIKKLIITAGNEDNARNSLALANEALIEEIGDYKIVKGETTDQAKLQYFLDNDGDYKGLLQKLPRISILTFDPKLKYIASLHQEVATGAFKIFVNGAPEILLNIAHTYISENGSVEEITSEVREKLDKEYEELASNGYRVLGIAERTFDTLEGGKHKDLEDEDTRNKLVSNLTFVGYAAIRDPIRDDVRESIEQVRVAGVRVIMMTGDHILTARAIGGDLGFSKEEGKVLEGKVVETLTNKELDELVKKVEIFARVNPEHKMRVIAALQRNGEVVAMTGDGVNDAPALKSADIGVAIGSGTDVAKAASDLILLNDSFSIIVSAIRQGRIAFDNIRKVSVFLLAGSFTEFILIMSALVLKLPFLPITAVQILWTNLIVDGLPNVALSFEPGDKDVMERPPLKKTEPVLDAESKIIIFVVGILTDIVLLAVFLFFLYFGDYGQKHLQTLILTALGLNTFFYIYSVKNLRESIFSYNILSNKYLVGATVIGVGLIITAVYAPFLNNLLGTVPLTSFDLLVILCIGIINIIGVEIAKWWFILRAKKERNHSVQQPA